MKASFLTLKVGKEAFTDLLLIRKYMKAPFLAPGARKGAFMYLGHMAAGAAVRRARTPAGTTSRKRKKYGRAGV
ncbi:hypothetical protein H074_37818 [Amycolatopsis decaplanina DSM 44594]|uniref:Uncharacterized protein n=1 Tax=Amycolatopsis decaplanina DSM 44594 TaxID=1284240 RepID=M2WQ33_9PSEU|nr:hypothetical protein H074_37818 [Amycolatopsis decaplanina DSM 44594]